MLITDKKELEKYYSQNRLWQGIPSIEVTKKGRIFSTFYSGGTKEEVRNYCILTMSDDGESFSEPIAVSVADGHRCYDPCVWIDPMDRLWFTWAYEPDHAVYGVICDDPDADELVWSKEFIIGHDVMMNKPTILSTGEWLFPVAVWKKGIFIIKNSDEEDRRAFVYKSVDNGKSFHKLGGVDMPQRSCDEHMILELNDGRLAMFVRTEYGIGVSYSYDRGVTWTRGEDSGIKCPCSRFFIRRLKSGRILLVNHYDFKGRNNITALLSEDEGATWKYKLLLDERANVSYPDAKEADDGYIYVTYDRNRGGFCHSLDEVYKSSREILYAKITEKDIIKGELTDKGSKLKGIVSQLGKYALENENPYDEITRIPSNELARQLSLQSADEIISVLFSHYSVNCMNMHKIDCNKLDVLIEELKNALSDKEKTITGIISVIRGVNDLDKKTTPVVERIKNIINADITRDLSLKDLSESLGISMYYMCHLFKETTGITIVDYKNSLRISKAKELLIHTDKKITEIAGECGFTNDSYFIKTFKQSENVSPTEYRNLLSTQGSK